MVQEVTVEDLRPYLAKRDWSDKNKPVRGKESSDDSFFEAMRESATRVNESSIMEAFRVSRP